MRNIVSIIVWNRGSVCVWTKKWMDAISGTSNTCRPVCCLWEWKDILPVITTYGCTKLGNFVLLKAKAGWLTVFLRLIIWPFYQPYKITRFVFWVWQGSNKVNFLLICLNENCHFQTSVRMLGRCVDCGKWTQFLLSWLWGEKFVPWSCSFSS